MGHSHNPNQELGLGNTVSCKSPNFLEVQYHFDGKPLEAYCCCQLKKGLIKIPSPSIHQSVYFLLLIWGIVVVVADYLR